VNISFHFKEQLRNLEVTEPRSVIERRVMPPMLALNVSFIFKEQLH